MRLRAAVVSVFACLFCAGAAPAERVPLQVDERSAQTHQEQQEAQPQRPAPEPPPEPEQERPTYRPDCEHPEDHQAADFCQQERMAQAAVDAIVASRDAVNATRDQNRLIIATLFISVFGTIAAVISAGVAQRTLTNLDRPHLYIKTKNVGLAFSDDVGPRDGKPENMIRTPTTFYFVNEGRAPAVVRRLHAGRIPLAAIRYTPDGKMIFPSPLAMNPMTWFHWGEIPHGASISANGGKSTEWSAVDYGLAEEDRTSPSLIEWYLIGYVIYSDPAGSAQYVTGFGLQFEHTRDRWVLGLHGKNSRRYNYSRRLGWPERSFWGAVRRFREWRVRADMRRQAKVKESVDPPKE